MAEFPDFAQLANLQLMDGLYKKYLTDPASVESSWRYFFEGMQAASFLSREKGGDRSDKVLPLIDTYRRCGHLKATFNPLQSARKQEGFSVNFKEEELKAFFPSHGLCAAPEAPLEDIIKALEEIYCGPVGFEFMHLDHPEMQKWIISQIEPKLDLRASLEEKKLILENLNRSELFESFLHTKYAGQRRFSIEGSDTLLPMLAAIIEKGTSTEFIIGMAHRGRLNVLANLLNKPYSVIFQEFEDRFFPMQFEESGDVKYHKGFSTRSKSYSGKEVHLHLAANSSCLESIDPVALGLARASKATCILIHGDASIAGQGVVYESLQLMRLPGYSVGGTVHIIVNNQVGFTTTPEEGRSTRYCSDIAKAFGCPVLHVNAEDPESALFAVKLAVDIRAKFQCDVFIDLNGYRKYGHNEGDEPVFTQPLQYREIRAKKGIRELYLEKLLSEGAIEQSMASQLEESFKKTLASHQEKAKEEDPHPVEERYGAHHKEFQQPSNETLFAPFSSGVSGEVLEKIASDYAKIPEGFHLHPKLQKMAEEREHICKEKANVDWALAECLAFGSLLLEEIPVRLAGQDVRRATFSHRHAAWIDQETGSIHFPLSHLSSNQASFEVYNSPLSEFACLAFEYGYSWKMQGLVLWEAQYGDFSIGAQTVIDHYITTAEQKWARYSSLVVLLPHGYEGQGPEHSSGRMERFLQLAALNNIQVVNPTTPAQYFHLLRRQALRKIKKPLIVFTPKSLLRHPACTSPFTAFTQGEFEEVLPDSLVVPKPRRLLVCSGKIYYELLAKRETLKQKEIAICRIEQLYPIHEKKWQELLALYPACPEVCWVQEEPENMGAWEFIQPHLQRMLPKVSLRYVGRTRSPVTATGSFKQHARELEQIMKEAFE